MKEIIIDELNKSANAIKSIKPEEVMKVAEVITDAISKGNQVIFMGNGGSSADAQHIAAEFSGRYLFDRPAMPGVCLSNIAPVTAIGNDYSYDLVFARQVEAFAKKGDVVVGISTSGNSKNVILAFEKAKSIGATTISFTGNGGKMKEISDYSIVIDSKDTPHIQEAYLVAGHMVCCIVERNIFGKKAVLIDRDDTIAKDVKYCNDPKNFELFNNVPESIKKLNDAGYLVIVVTNQSGIARKILNEEILEKIHDKMKNEISKSGGHIDDIFFCPHHPDDNCKCRKPEIGMGLNAVKKHHINIKESYMIGNSDADVEFGKRLGCKKSIMVTEKYTFENAVDDILKS